MAVTKVDARDGTTLQHLADKLAAAKRIVMVTGAGISTNCGIPDFRSKEGLYSMINKEYNSRLRTRRTSSIGNLSGKDLFDSAVWNDDLKTSVFYTFIASLRQKVNEVKRPSDAHKFIRTLRDQRKLVRCYTQNVDGLESRENLNLDLSSGKGSRSRFTPKALALPAHATHLQKEGQLYGGCEVVPLHGDLKYLRCTLCQETFDWEVSGHNRTYLSGSATQCARCVETDEVRRAGGKRGTKIGVLRPNVVLYGEPHPNEDELSACLENDLSLRPDLLLVMGTSLKVKGIQRVVAEFAKTVHNKKGGTVIFVNMTKPADSTWSNLIDYWVNMDCDRYVSDLKKRRADIFSIQVPLSFKDVGKGVDKKLSSGKAAHIQKMSVLSGPKGKENDPPSVRETGLPNLKRFKRNLGVYHSKQLDEQQRTPLKAVQLPTPPSSGSSSRKRQIDRETECTARPDETPSKKRKKFYIWSDLSDSSMPISEDFNLELEIPTGKRHKKAEIPDSEDSSSPVLDPTCLEDRIKILRDSMVMVRQRGRPKIVVPKESRPRLTPKIRLAER